MSEEGAVLAAACSLDWLDTDRAVERTVVDYDAGSGYVRNG